MKFFLLITFLLLSIKESFAQNQFNFTADSDTAFLYSDKNREAEKFQLSLIESDTAEYQFCFWSPGLVVNIVNDHGTKYGALTFFVESLSDSMHEKTFKKIYKVSSPDAATALALVKNFRIADLPSDKDIKGWKQGLDGVTYFIEYKKDKQYSFKHYWTPDEQGSLREAKRLLNFISALEKRLHLKDYKKRFVAGIPFNSWTYPGSGTIIIRSASQSKKKFMN